MCRAVRLANLGQESPGKFISPFETALTRQPRPSQSGMPLSCSPGTLVSPFDSATSFPEFLSSASFPGKQGRRDESPSTATAVSPLESDLGHFDLDRRAITQMNQLSHSQPPSPKTPKQCVEAEDGTAQVDVQQTGSEAAWQGNPIRGHPRYSSPQPILRCMEGFPAPPFWPGGSNFWETCLAPHACRAEACMHAARSALLVHSKHKELAVEACMKLMQSFTLQGCRQPLAYIAIKQQMSTSLGSANAFAICS